MEDFDINLMEWSMQVQVDDEVDDLDMKLVKWPTVCLEDKFVLNCFYFSIIKF